jgi:hypothetical protein
MSSDLEVGADAAAATGSGIASPDGGRMLAMLVVMAEPDPRPSNSRASLWGGGESKRIKSINICDR